MNRQSQTRKIAASGGSPGTSASPIIDPSENVRALSEASNQRQDDLRELTDVLTKERIMRLENISAHIKEMSDIRDVHAKEMRVSEAARLDSIRQVDVTAVRTEATRALEAIQTLAATAARDAETLRVALVNTAATMAAQTSDTVRQLNERIAALEKSSYEGVGKQRLQDPQMLDLLAEVKILRGTKSQGVDTTWKIIGAVLGTAATIGAMLIGFAAMNSGQ